MSISKNVSNCIDEFIHQLNNTEMYDVVILMTRKLYSLYRSYITVSEEVNPERKRPLIIINDAIPFFFEQMRGKRILIIDDIMIHGRTVEKVSAMLKEQGISDIDYRVFAISAEEQEQSSSIKGAVDSKAGVVRNNVRFSMRFQRTYWRRISREIVNRIRETLTPMRSAASYLTIDYSNSTFTIDEVIDRVFSERLALECNDPEYTKVKSILVDFPLVGSLSCLTKVVDAIKLQVDYLKDDASEKKAILVPHIFMSPMHEDDIAAVWNGLNMRGGDSSDYRIAQYKSLKFFISLLICEVLRVSFFKEFEKDEVLVQLNDSDISFLLPSDMESQVVSEHFASLFLSVIESINCKGYAINENSANIMEQLYCKDRSFLENITDCGFADEILFKYPTDKRSGRIEGARICYLTEVLGVSYVEIIYTLAHSITTLNCQLKGRWLTERVLPGEQAYLEHLLKNPEMLVRVQIQAAEARLISEVEYRRALAQAFGRYEQQELDKRLQNIVAATGLKKYMDSLEQSKHNDMYREFLYDYVQYMADIDIYSLYKTFS